jgi:hypothetical protein
MKLFFSFSFTISICLFASSQTLQSPNSEIDTTLYEKLYLHFDREFYSPGDDIWFKSYLVSGINHRLIPGYKNVYVQLVADDGKIIDQQMMMSIFGAANSDFHLPDTLPAGQYTIRAYTKYLQNFEEESLFHQKIYVSRTTDLPELKEKPEEKSITDISFLPEGGNLVINAANYIAFKAIDKSGKGVSVSGMIVDEEGQEVAVFESKYKGMGKFLLMPKEGKKYIARIDGYPNFRYQLEDARFDGVTLHYQANGNNLQFILNRNFKSGGWQNLTLLASHKGEELFREDIVMKDFQHAVTFYKGFFPKGISKITLLDEQESILAERLVFVRNPDETNLNITSDKKGYNPREKIELQLESLLDSESDSIVAGLSLAVVNEDYFSKGGKMQTIESYLLLDSELKVPLESPASCFTDEENITAGEKLDLVMMVNGWRRYYWNELKDYFNKPLPGWNDSGLTIEGEVKTLWGGKPVSEGTVELGPFSGQFLILKDTTDEQGRFLFDRLYIKDSALVMINAFNPKGRQRNVEVTYKPAPLFNSRVSSFKLKKIAQPIEVHEGYQESSFKSHLAEREFILEHGSILLGEVEVIEEYRTGPVVTGTRGFRDREFTLSDKDKEYYDILKYLEFEVPGIFVYMEDSVRMGPSGKSPAFYVDDVATPLDIVRNLSMDEIVKVEIFNPQIQIGLLGDWNANGLPKDGGVISILTTNRFGAFPHKFVRNINNRVVPRIQGFRQAREFYSPQYPLAQQDFPEKPDQRPTLYWEPYVLTVNNKANIDFHASDMTGKYRVIAEGISSKGKIIWGSTVFDVVPDK